MLVEITMDFLQKLVTHSSLQVLSYHIRICLQQLRPEWCNEEHQNLFKVCATRVASSECLCRVAYRRELLETGDLFCTCQQPAARVRVQTRGRSGWDAQSPSGFTPRPPRYRASPLLSPFSSASPPATLRRPAAPLGAHWGTTCPPPLHYSILLVSFSFILHEYRTYCEERWKWRCAEQRRGASLLSNE